MILNNSNQLFEAETIKDATGKTIGWKSKLVPFEDMEIVEETVTIKRRVKKGENCTQPCLLEAARIKEMEKPPHMRNMAFYISCPCPRCSPRY